MIRNLLTWKLLSRPATVGLLTCTVAGVSLFSFASSSYAARSSNGTAAQCSLGTLNRTYIFSSDGFNIMGNDHIPFADAGHETFDGNGHVRGVVSLSTNGKITRLVHYNGTYTITPQCTGIEIVPLPGTTLHFDQFIAPDGHELTFVETDPGTVSASTVEVRVGS